MPVYNVENYIERSIKSVLNQTFEKIELIIVNDGSTDTSLDICTQYASIDNRIILINQENKGVSAARNMGLKIANGKYIGFIDPDDWIESNMYEKLFNDIEMNQSDMVMCGLSVDYKDKSILKNLDFDKGNLNKDNIRNKIILNMIGSEHLFEKDNIIMGSVCRVLLSNLNINKWNIKFKENIGYMEDLVFLIEYLLKSEKVSIINEALYHYVQNTNSAVNTYRENNHDDRLFVYNQLCSLIDEVKLSKKSKVYFNNRYIDIFIKSIINETHYANDQGIVSKLKKIKYYCKDDKLKLLLKNIDFKLYSYKHKVILKLIKYEKALLLYIYYNSINKRKSRKLR